MPLARARDRFCFGGMAKEAEKEEDQKEPWRDGARAGQERTITDTIGVSSNHSSKISIRWVCYVGCGVIV